MFLEISTNSEGDVGFTIAIVFLLLFAIFAFGVAIRLRKIPKGSKGIQNKITTATKHTNKTQNNYFSYQYENEYRIMKDSLYLLQSTTNLDTFVMRFDLCLQKANLLLLQLDKKAAKTIGHPNLLDECNSIINNADDLKAQGLIRYFDKSVSESSGLKTPNGRKNRYIKIKDALQSKSAFFGDLAIYTQLYNEVEALIDSPSDMNIHPNHINTGSPIQEEILYSFLLDNISLNSTPTKPIHITDYERLFFCELEKQLQQSGLDPKQFRLRRMGDMRLRLELFGMQIGDIYLRGEKCDILYFINTFKFRNLQNISFEDVMDKIPFLVNYAGKCLHV